MALQGWNEKFSVNNPKMDSDHRELVTMISTLHEAMKKGQSKLVISDMVDKLLWYANTHFSREEEMLKSIQYSDLPGHKMQHVLFLQKVGEFKTNLENGHSKLAVQMLPFLNNWFLNHIMKIDMKYKA